MLLTFALNSSYNAILDYFRNDMQKQAGFFVFLRESIPGTIWAIGVSSLLINISTSVVFSGSALYMKSAFGVAISTIALLEAIVEAIAHCIRIFSGILSDYLRNRKYLMCIGFVLIAVSKPLLAFSGSVFQVFLARTIERLGNGIQATPRDAMVSEVAKKEQKGACFGMRQSLAVVGSTLGGILGVVVMSATNNSFRAMFLYTGIPAFVAVLIVIFFVKESNSASAQKSLHPKWKLRDCTLLGGKFWILMAIVSIFMLGKFSETFIALHACENFGLGVGYATVITTSYNIVSALVSYPIGRLSDKMDRPILLLCGFALLIFSHLLIWFSLNLPMIFAGTMLWGAHIGITQSILAALVSDFVPRNLRGTGFGVYYLITAISNALASITAGIIAQKSGEASAFLFGAAFCSIAFLTLLIARKHLKCDEL
ncbi:MFS transporter [Alphaproteobacteria bacterium]|nr:MFS transporter [Alphaproteobacteria bacterium]